MCLQQFALCEALIFFPVKVFNMEEFDLTFETWEDFLFGQGLFFGPKVLFSAKSVFGLKFRCLVKFEGNQKQLKSLVKY